MDPYEFIYYHDKGRFVQVTDLDPFDVNDMCRGIFGVGVFSCRPISVFKQKLFLANQRAYWNLGVR